MLTCKRHVCVEGEGIGHELRLTVSQLALLRCRKFGDDDPSLLGAIGNTK
jgi:hypothetical protein